LHLRTPIICISSGHAIYLPFCYPSSTVYGKGVSETLMAYFWP
jgi:hypothetical protein